MDNVGRQANSVPMWITGRDSPIPAFIISKKIDTFAAMHKKIDTKTIEKISKALGDPYRIQMIEVINKKQDWMQCSMIVEMFDLAQSTISHHLKQLVDADLLLVDKDGRNTKYKINKEVFGDYVGFLNHFER
jgi:ArsR family transcriptional regulator